VKAEFSPETVRTFFDREARAARRILPVDRNVSGLGSLLKYEQAAALMADETVGHALDVGCNRGSIEMLFHMRFPEKASRTVVEGVDISEGAIQQANDLGLKGCRFRCYDGSTLPFSSESFDLIVLVEVIEHVPDKKRLLSELSRVLRPEGQLFLTTPNPDCWALKTELFIWALLRGIFRRSPPLKDSFISYPSLQAVCGEFGLEPLGSGSPYSWPHAFVYFQGWSLVPPLPPFLLLRYQKWCLRSLERNRWPNWLRRGACWSTVMRFRRSDPMGR
jgi:SAM-dependent methyltransferase